jgi:hypothetical protein
MTIALCFKCGDTKFGALLKCQKCSADPTGNVSLDILFTDHNFSAQTLSEFGNVIKAIALASDNDALSFSAFLLYISNNHNDQKTTLCNALLEKAKAPLIKIE